MSDCDPNEVAKKIREIGGVVLANVVVNLQRSYPEVPPEHIPGILMVAALNLIMHVHTLDKEMAHKIAFSFVVSMVTTLKINGIDLKIDVPDLTSDQKVNVGFASAPTEGNA